MSFSAGFKKTAFIAPVLGALGRGALGAVGTVGKGVAKGALGLGSKTLGLASKVSGGPINLAFTGMDAASQFKQNMNALKSSYRG